MKNNWKPRSTIGSLFYDKIRADEEIAFYFNDMIQDWDEHLKN
jgi:hemoglobin